MATFSELPAELVEFITSYLAQRDLCAISRVNKSLNTLATPSLYRIVDLIIQPGDKLPRIDRFCLNILQNPQLAARVERLSLGPSSQNEVKEGQRWLQRDLRFDDEAMYHIAMNALDKEPLITGEDYLRDAIMQKEYSAYAALLVLVLPKLQHLDISDFTDSTMDRLLVLLRNLNAEKAWIQRQPSPALLERLGCIKTMSCNIDRRSGLSYPDQKSRVHLDQVLNLPGLEALEFSVTDTQAAMSRAAIPGVLMDWPSRLLVSQVRATNITKLVVRYSTSCALSVRPLLACAPHLTSFTWDIAYDCCDRQEAPERWIDLDAWTTTLSVAKQTLQTLVFAVEYFDSSRFAFEQPRTGSQHYGFLDLTGFDHLHTLEVPIPFLTGDIDFSITADIYPLLPPFLKHLSLRLDLTHVQSSYYLDTSILPEGLNRVQSQAEARYVMNARMDLSYAYHATLALFDHAPFLERLSVWQPADPSMSWFDGQISDFATTCRNRSIVGALLYPMQLRWKDVEHRDLVREIRFGSSQVERLERLCRCERAGIPLGLASQYHLLALRARLVRRRGTAQEANHLLQMLATRSETIP